MSILYLSDLDKVCRGCLGKNGDMRPLFGSYLDNMLQMVANIEVKVNDGLPQLMCVPCVLQVSRAFTFKQQCQRSDSALRTIFEEVEKSAGTIEDVMIDLNAMKTVEMGPKEEPAVACNNLNVMDGGQMQMQLAEPQATDEIFPPASDNVNLSKCLLIVHSVPSNILPDDIDGNLVLEASHGPSDNGNAFISTSLSNHHAAPGTSIDELHGSDLKPTMQNIKLENVIIDDNDLEVDMGEHFDAYSSKDDDETSFTIDESVAENILNILPVQNESKNTCVDCNLLFDTKENLKAHRRSKHNSFNCHVCHKVFAENKILKRHLKIHNPNKPHSCSICLMKFAESSNLTKHMKKHTGELRNVVGKPNLCSVCGKGFKWASSLSKHMKHHTKHKILNCPYCPKYYVEARSLNIHLRSHTGEKPFVCEVCNKGFTQLGNLEKHVRVHTGERPYACPVCRKGFSQSGYVAIHMRTHTGERPYVCTECGKGFASSNTLAIHKRTHTGERPYSCNICSKTFARHETVIIHQRTHTGEKPHICSICNRGFASSGHLTGHMRSHSGRKTHECNVCGKRLAGSSSLKVHMRTHDRTDDIRPNAIMDLDIDDKTALSTIYECNVCNQHVTESSFEHQIVDGVLICSNLNSIIVDDGGDNSDLVEMHNDDDDNNLILPDDIVDGSNQQIIISLSGLKEEIF